jgi:hypothetical protein
MANYLMESIHDLLALDSESISDSSSSRGSYHPSCECFMADVVDDAFREETPNGAVQSVSDGNETPPNPSGQDAGEADTGLPPHLRLERLRARQQELKDVRLALKLEHAELKREITRR